MLPVLSNQEPEVDQIYVNLSGLKLSKQALIDKGYKEDDWEEKEPADNKGEGGF